MITPRFRIRQDEDFVIINIQAPYVKFSEGEMVILKNEFAFYCKPYHLKLFFTGDLCEDGRESALYTTEAGEFEIKLPKAYKGEHFVNLDMLNVLLTPPNTGKVKGRHLVEVLSDSAFASQDLSDVSDDEIDWSVDQVLPQSSLAYSLPKYGFNNSAAGVFSKHEDEQSELLDIKDPDNVPASLRAAMKHDHERQCFNPDHYVADMYDDETVIALLGYDMYDDEDFKRRLLDKCYTPDEIDCLLKMPKKELLLDKDEKRIALLGLLDILYGYFYEMRTTGYTGSVESAWTIRKLSSTLSWLHTACSIRSVILSSVRRSLCFPLYRHWVLSMKVLEDLKSLLHLGKMSTLKCLLHIHKIFNNNECYHIMNDLYITDYCIWVQTLTEGFLEEIANLIDKIHISKCDVELNLQNVELKALESSGSEDESKFTSSSEEPSSDDEFSGDSSRHHSTDVPDILDNKLASLTLGKVSGETLLTKQIQNNHCSLIEEI